MHIDQYSGAVLADYRYDHYGVVGKAVALGITLHKGTQFGIVNQIFSLLICIGIIFIAVSGLYLWWKRKPEHGLGAPKAPEVKAKNMKVFLLLHRFGDPVPACGLVAHHRVDHRLCYRSEGTDDQDISECLIQSIL